MQPQDEDMNNISYERISEPSLFHQSSMQHGQKVHPRPMKDILAILARTIVAILSLLVVLLTSLLSFQSPNCGGIDIKAPSIVPCIYAPPDLHLLIIVCITVVFLNIVFHLFLEWNHRR